MKKSRWNTLRGYFFKNKDFDNDGAHKQVRLVQAYQNIFQDEFGNLTNDGEIVIKDLMQRGYVSNSVAMLTKDYHVDVQATMIAEGKRTLVLEIIEMLGFDLLKAIELQKDNVYE
jgi:hypothetical protein